MKLGLFMVQKSHLRAHVIVLSRGRCMCVCVCVGGRGGGRLKVACNSAVDPTFLAHVHATWRKLVKK